VLADVLFVVVVFLDVPPVTPFLIVLIIVRFAAGVTVVFAATDFLTTVDVLPSLVLLAPLSLLVVLVVVAFAAGAGAAAPRLVRVPAEAPEELEDAVEDVVAFLVAATRLDLAFSTMFDRMFVAPPVRAVVAGFVGDAGLAMRDFAGDTGARGPRRVFADVGDKTCAGCAAASSAAGGPRCLFLGFSIGVFSLSSPAISSLFCLLGAAQSHGYDKIAHLNLFNGRLEA
jgi:hypothetical protein